jgi:hypothetical protein
VHHCVSSIGKREKRKKENGREEGKKGTSETKEGRKAEEP